MRIIVTWFLIIFKKTGKFAEVTVERLVEENGYYDPLFAFIGKKSKAVAEIVNSQ